MSASNHGRGEVKLGVEQVESRLVLTPSVPTIDVSYVGTTLTITGDNLNDNFRVREVTVGGGKAAPHELQISSGDHGNTKVISSDKTLTVDAHGNIMMPSSDVVDAIAINLGKGNNTVFVSQLRTFAPASLTISDGGAAGNNTVTVSVIKGAVPNTAVNVSLGTGNDYFAIGGANLASLTATLASTTTTKDNVQLNGDNVTGATSITTGAGRDHFRIGGDNFTTPHGVYSGPVTVSLGDGNDLGYINTATFSSTLDIDGGTGTNLMSGYARMSKANLTVVNATNHIITF